MHDPFLIIEGLSQSINDAYEDKGICYVTGYAVGEVAQLILLKKAGDKLKSVKGAESAADLEKSAKITVEEITSPGSKNSVKVYTDGYAQVNKGKIEVYIRGKIKEPENLLELKNRIKELEKLKSSKSPEFTKELKKELKTISDKVHNYERSKGMGELLEKAGIPDTIENNQKIAETVLDAAKDVTRENTKIRRVLHGTNGDVIVESWWMLGSDNIPYCSTIILIEVK